MAAAAQPSTRPGMGALVYPGGVAFRVWAPFAQAVTVAGDFNAWSSAATPLAAEGQGYWSADVPAAASGSEYKFVLVGPSGTVWRKDPYGREVNNSADNSIVRSADFEWGDAAYQTPPWNKMVIYELHVGTFNDPDQDRPGSFASVAARLDYLADLGVNVIEIMPSMEFATDFSWGYNPLPLS